MKKLLYAIILIIILCGTCYSATFDWWGEVGYRQRYETIRNYSEASSISGWGELRDTDENARTLLGYKIGLNIDISDNISASLTFRSGHGSVMHQEIGDKEQLSPLLPGLLEGYINWKTPFAEVHLGRIPQKGNAMWDLYAATKPQDKEERRDNPVDGIFNDRMGALNGIRIIAPVGPLTLRGVYHTDYTGGYRSVFEKEGKAPIAQLGLDQKIYLVGCSLDVDDLYNKTFYYLGVDHKMPDFVNLDYGFDYGWPYRIGDKMNPSVKDDSTHTGEEIWGMDVMTGIYFDDLNGGVRLSFSYAYDWRDSVYTEKFWDYKLDLDYSGQSLTFRYQYNHQDIYDPLYNVNRMFREALHIYFTLNVWGLEIQPRYIKFDSEYEKPGAGVSKRFKSYSKDRYEITTTVRF